MPHDTNLFFANFMTSRRSRRLTYCGGVFSGDVDDVQGYECQSKSIPVASSERLTKLSEAVNPSIK